MLELIVKCSTERSIKRILTLVDVIVAVITAPFIVVDI